MSGLSKYEEVYQQFMVTPEHKVAEIIDGELITHPRPASLQTLATTVLLSELYRPFGHHNADQGSWVVLREPELRLAHDILVPNIAGWRRERMP